MTVFFRIFKKMGKVVKSYLSGENKYIDREPYENTSISVCCPDYFVKRARKLFGEDVNIPNLMTTAAICFVEGEQPEGWMRLNSLDQPEALNDEDKRRLRKMWGLS